MEQVRRRCGVKALISSPAQRLQLPIRCTIKKFTVANKGRRQIGWERCIEDISGHAWLWEERWWWWRWGVGLKRNVQEDFKNHIP